MLKANMRTTRQLIACITTLVFLSPGFAGDMPARLSIGLDTGVLATSEPGYDTLNHATVGGSLSLSLWQPWSMDLALSYSWAAPSAYSDAWYRYRGFASLGLSLGASFQPTDLGGIRFGLSLGGFVARYDLSYSFFYYPRLSFDIDYPAFRLGSGWTLDAGLSLPLYFRADAFTAGFEAVFTVSWTTGGGNT